MTGDEGLNIQLLLKLFKHNLFVNIEELTQPLYKNCPVSVQVQNTYKICFICQNRFIPL